MSTEAVDITLIDLAMPDISGLQLGLQLRQHKPELAILFCSGYPDLVAANSNEMDGDLFLKKPFSLRDLSSKIDLLLQGKRLAPLRTAAND